MRCAAADCYDVRKFTERELRPAAGAAGEDRSIADPRRPAAHYSPGERGKTKPLGAALALKAAGTALHRCPEACRLRSDDRTHLTLTQINSAYPPRPAGPACRLDDFGHWGFLGKNTQNLSRGVHQTKGIGFFAGMASGDIMRPQLSGCDRLGRARQDRGFRLDHNASLEPNDCKQFGLLSA
jgi:hypothetical protein